MPKFSSLSLKRRSAKQLKLDSVAPPFPNSVRSLESTSTIQPFIIDDVYCNTLGQCAMVIAGCHANFYKLLLAYSACLPFLNYNIDLYTSHYKYFSMPKIRYQRLCLLSCHWDVCGEYHAWFEFAYQYVIAVTLYYLPLRKFGFIVLKKIVLIKWWDLRCRRSYCVMDNGHPHICIGNLITNSNHNQFEDLLSFNTMSILISALVFFYIIFI